MELLVTDKSPALPFEENIAQPQTRRADIGAILGDVRK
jgi:hypothetical protein